MPGIIIITAPNRPAVNIIEFSCWRINVKISTKPSVTEPTLIICWRRPTRSSRSHNSPINTRPTDSTIFIDFW